MTGIFNCGTGRAQTSNNLAHAVISNFKLGQIEYVPFPDHLEGRYQSFTEANIDSLPTKGYSASFMNVEEGVHQYIEWLSKQPL